MNLEGIEVAGKSTTIKISTELRDELTKLGTMDDSYDSVIRRLVKYYKKNVKPFDRITRS
jgi:predicted CopG family antitoxin